MHARLTWSLPFLSALLLWASFHPLDLGFLAWVALVPLVVFAKRTSGRLSFFVAWLAGALFFGAGFFWVRYTVPVGPYLLAVYKGLYVALFVALVRKLGALWTPALWTGLEFVRSYLFGGLPWFLLGYTQHGALRLIQGADLGGVWLISALVAFVNGALADGRFRARAAAAASIALLFVYGGVRLATLRLEDGPAIALVQPNIPQDLKLLSIERPEQAVQNYQKHFELSTRAAEGKPDLIVWPEAAIYRGLVYDPGEPEPWRDTPWHRRVTAPARKTGVRHLVGLLVVEVREDGEDEYTNSAVDVDPERGIVGRFDKVHLVPFAEFVPFARTFPWMRELIYRYSGLRLADMRPGAGFPLWSVGGHRFGTQICFEAIFPEISREIARNGGSFTVNISNDGWFRDSAELDQMLAMARFRAVENRMHVIRATNTGISAFLSPDGRVQAVLEERGRVKEVEGVLTARLKTTGSSSLYRALGNWVGWAAAGACVAGLALRIFVDRQKRPA